jgi:histidinol-phosphate/aromatic aminotransferase/cobyric acid decarboxylase-like protein
MSLRRVLQASAPGRRVLDVGRGLGARASELAAAGFEVVGVDASEPAVEEAARRAPFDAALCLGCLDSGPDATKLRLLRRLREVLAPGGVLVAEGAAELAALVRRGGFQVERPGSGAVVVAHPLPAPPRSLAVTAWRTPPGVRLDLRYAPDEAELLDPSPSGVWEEVVRSVARGGAEVVSRYAVDDPYGAERGAAVVGAYFGCPVEPHRLTFAAGVTSLLHDLCGLADGGPIVAPALVHGDLEAWAAARGTPFRLLPEPVTAERLLADLERGETALLHLDRPTFTGELLELDELEAVAHAAARVDAPVLVDESAAPYLGPAASAATLVHRLDNLVVLRGFTKAYSWGGLRAGFALASDGLAPRVRELVAPLQVGELALLGALRLLATGDVFGRLRERVRAMKPATVELLEAAGLAVVPGLPILPWVAVHDPGGAASRLLRRRGIRALEPVSPPVHPPRPAEVLRLTIPLSDERLELLRTLLARSEQAVRRPPAGARR